MNTEFKKENFKNKVQILVRYDDLDTLGHVNNKTYLSYLEESRINYLSEVLNLKKNSLDFDVVVGRIDIKYLFPIFLNDDVDVYTRISRIGERSYDFECYVVKNKNNKIQTCAFASVTLVSVDLKTGKTKLNNPKMIDSILKYEPIKPIFQTNKI
ncbi:MAG: acyl-CoA thioesterase [Chlorobi bacterium]|nr:acyl-CoA thioesterase [Chlorobiota bacterium]